LDRFRSVQFDSNVGCRVFTLANADVVMIASINALIVWRFIAMQVRGAATVLEMAIVRDPGFEGSAAGHRFSYINLVVGIAPMIAHTRWMGSPILPAVDLRVLAVGGCSVITPFAIRFGESVRVATNKNAIAPPPSEHLRISGRSRIPAIGLCARINRLSFGCMLLSAGSRPSC